MKKYVDVSVSDELLERLEREKQQAEGMARYGRFKAWLHYANLRRWQGQGWHFSYVNYAGKELHCTCGLSVPIDYVADLQEESKLNLDLVQRTYGHRRLPSLTGVTVAFIIDFTWLEDKGAYWFRSLCQVCGASTGYEPPAVAVKFERQHNKSCLSAVASTLEISEEKGGL